MVLEWLSRLLSGFSSNLGGFDSRSIWSTGRGSISENIFQNQQLEKFTPAFTYQTNLTNILDKLNTLSDFSYAEQAVKRVNQQRQTNLDFIDKEVQALRGIEIPTPSFISYERYGKRPSVGEVYDRPYSYGKGGGVRRWWFVNPMNYAENQRQRAEFATYKEGALNQISTNINNLLGKRDLITSRDEFSL